jgi:hypothetical protein
MLIRSRCIPRVGNKWHQDVVGNSSVRLMKRAVGIRISLTPSRMSKTILMREITINRGSAPVLSKKTSNVELRGFEP